MNQALERLAAQVGLLDAGNERMRLAFALACAGRVRHLLEEPRAAACLSGLDQYLQGNADRQALEAARQESAQLANQHRGSRSIDGSDHAAVSATYAVANALAGKPIEAASYAAYATVYSYGGYAVTDPGSFQPEFEWQVAALQSLAAQSAGQASAAGQRQRPPDRSGMDLRT
jgi:hypothetical protein